MKNNKKIIALVLTMLVVGVLLFKTFLGVLLFKTLEPYFKKSKSAENNTTESGAVLEPADFMTDSCYSFIQKQVDFGPRVPGNASHV
ncbi:MAG: hypothetical protein ACEQSL_10870, partial [Sediminibacterium sp.]